MGTGCAKFAAAEWRRDLGWVRAVMAVSAAAAVVALDRSPSDFANQATLLAVLRTAGGVAGAAPHRWILAGALPVTTLVIAHLLHAFGIGAPGYTMHPPGTVGALSLFVLLVGTLPVVRVCTGVGSWRALPPGRHPVPQPGPGKGQQDT
jgi:hypothetical protein